jgi:hypothetical protein
MNWFERHLNWSLILGLIYIPANVSFTIGLIASIVMFVIAFIKVGGGFNEIALVLALAAFAAMATQVEKVLSVVSIIITAVLVLLFTSWFLDGKGRSKVFLLLFIISWVIGIIGLLNAGNFIGGILISVSILANVLSLIILLLLGNEKEAFDTELLASQPLDNEQFGAYDNWPPRELDYNETSHTVDIGDIKDVNSRDVSAASVVSQEAATEDKVVEKPVRYESPKMPILLDDAGAVITCFYHPGADAVILCSRCKQYVCSQCSYVTGTNPICRNCWERRGESPIIAPTAQKQDSPELGKSEKQKVVEAGKPKKQRDIAPGKSKKLEVDKNEWLSEFTALHEQAATIINVVIRKSADGMPASPLDLMEGLKLRPMLERAKKLSKPKEKELREAKNDFEQLLSSCIKIADTAADFVSGGGQALLGGPDYARIVGEIETASGLAEKLSQKLASLSKYQE